MGNNQPRTPKRTPEQTLKLYDAAISITPTNPREAADLIKRRHDLLAEWLMLTGNITALVEMEQGR